MAAQIPDSELSEYREIFSLIDTDGSGYITQAQYLTLMQALHLRPSEAELAEVFSAGDGEMHIGFDRFVRAMSRRVRREYTPAQLRGAFRLFETDDLPPGYVSSAVLKHALVTYGTTKMSPEEATRLLMVIDPDNTGEINYEDFVAMISES